MIIPAILEKTPHGFAEKLVQISILKSKIKAIQVDFADGLFVRGQTMAISDFQAMGMLSDHYQWEAHLMIIKPENFAEYKNVGFSTIIVHYESFESEQHMEEALDSISKLGMKPAIAINPETPVSVLRYFTDNIKQFTILSVEPGKQGNPFLPGSIDRVKILRNMAPNATIEVDGGINLTNAGALIQAGADCLAVGSGLFETENIKQNYEQIESAGTTI
jgi:ribulose-phosphate 3-epimerase